MPTNDSTYTQSLLSKQTFLARNFFSDCSFNIPTKYVLQAEVAVAGRIECDADARLNPKSVVLQGTWEQSLSQAVPVDLDKSVYIISFIHSFHL